MSQQEVFQGLDQASEKHEKELVIELSSDRILHFLGVYFVILLAVVTKITEITSQQVSCFPLYEDKSDLNYVKHVTNFCWESSNVSTPECYNSIFQKEENLNETEYQYVKFLCQSTLVKRFIQWMPYAMLFEAFLFAIPMALWHFAVGARLMGHLHFIKLLFADIYESVKTLPAGIYTKTAYDKDGSYLNCWGYFAKELSTKPGSENILAATRSRPITSVRVLEQSRSEEEGSENTEDLGRSSENSENPQDSDGSVKTSDHSTDAEVSETQSLITKVPQDVSETELTEEDGEDAEETVKNEATAEVTILPDEDASNALENNDTSAHVDKIRKLLNNKPCNISDVVEVVSDPNFVLLEENCKKTKGRNDPSEEEEVHNDTTQKDKSRWEKFLVGKMTDRHIFSMICYENFASFQHQPYLKSVHQLTAVPNYESDEKRILPLKDGILRQFCHKENFQSLYLIKTYILKCLLSILISFSVFLTISGFFIFAILPIFQTNAFLCQVPFHKDLFECTLTRIIDIQAAFFANWFIVTVHLMLSILQFVFVRLGSDHKLSHFFDDVKNLSGVALVAAHVTQKNKK